MDYIDTAGSEAPSGDALGRPRLLDYIWRPWYAKLWWAAIAVFWAGAWLYPLFGVQRLPVSSTVLIYVATILHPQAAYTVLGFGYVRALFAVHAEKTGGVDVHEEDDGFRHDLYGRNGFMAYLSDPGDTRSPLNPANPANWRIRGRHHR